MSKMHVLSGPVRLAKHASFHLLSRAGVSAVVGRARWRQRRLLILCYHGIGLGDEHEWDPGLYVPVEHFKRRLELLERNQCTVLPLDEAIERLYRNDLPERAVTLTFDDGYHDFATAAWPVLRERGYPATVYLTTARVSRNVPIVHLFLSYILWTARERMLDGRGLPGLWPGMYPLRTAPERDEVLRRVMEAARAGEPRTNKDDVARGIAERLGLSYDEARRRRLLTLLNPDEVRRLATEGVDFQLHTHVHRTPEDPELFMRDVLVNRERIRSLTGRDARHLCYPSGGYRMAYLPVLREHGIASATTCDPGLASAECEPLLLPRFVDTCAVDDRVFEGWLTGLAAWLPRRTRLGSLDSIESRPTTQQALPSVSPQAQTR